MGLVATLREGFRDLGYLEGSTISLEIRYCDNNPKKPRDMAARLVLDVDVIVAAGDALFAVHNMTNAVPIVSGSFNEIVLLGLALSISRPGANITGLSSFGAQLMAKRLELLKAIIPHLDRAGVFLRRGGPTNS